MWHSAHTLSLIRSTWCAAFEEDTAFAFFSQHSLTEKKSLPILTAPNKACLPDITTVTFAQIDKLMGCWKDLCEGNVHTEITSYCLIHKVIETWVKWPKSGHWSITDQRLAPGSSDLTQSKLQMKSKHLFLLEKLVIVCELHYALNCLCSELEAFLPLLQSWKTWKSCFWRSHFLCKQA